MLNDRKILAMLGVTIWLAVPHLGHAEGAIARGEDGEVGLSYNYRGPRSADDAALDYCGRSCHIVQRFQHACGAIAKTRRGGYGYAVRDGERGAQRAAMEHCADQNNGCYMFLSGCDD